MHGFPRIENSLICASMFIFPKGDLSGIIMFLLNEGKNEEITLPWENVNISTFKHLRIVQMKGMLIPSVNISMTF